VLNLPRRCISRLERLREYSPELLRRRFDSNFEPVGPAASNIITITLNAGPKNN